MSSTAKIELRPASQMVFGSFRKFSSAGLATRRHSFWRFRPSPLQLRVRWKLYIEGQLQTTIVVASELI